MNKSYFSLLFFMFTFFVVLAQPNPTSLPCGTLTGQSLTSNGYSGGNATSTAGSCGQCCYQGSDLDNDGDADVNFSVENSKWYRYCNPSSTTPITVDFIVDETNNDCNLQGAVFVTAGTSAAGATDALDIDCSNQEYAQFGSGVSGNADGFSFTGVTIPAGGCAWLMVDGYGGASCGAFAIQTICPPACITPTLVTAGLDKLICEGTSVALTTTVSGGVTTIPGPTYSWTPSTGLSCTNCQNPTANPTSTQTYSFTTCNGGPGFCCKTDVITVSVTPAFVANAGPDVVTCSPSTVTIGGTPTGPTGSTYTWVVSGTNNTGIAISSGSTTANPVVTINSGLPNGSTETYSVTVVNGACIRTDLVTVTVGNLAVNAAADQTVCAGSSITLGGIPTAPAGSTYSWVCSGTACPSLSLSSTTAANPIITAASSASGTANYTVTASLSGCVNTDIVAITVNPLPTIPSAVATPTAVCAGQTVTLTASGGAGSGTYSWWSAPTNGTNLGSANTLTVSPTTTTTYYIQSTDVTTGCTSQRGTITLSVNPTPVANAGNDQTLCVGQSFLLNAVITNSLNCTPAQTWSVITGSGSFSPNANTLNATFTPSSSGTITVRLIPCSSGGCAPVSDDIIFTVAPSPTISVSSTNTLLCQGLISDLSGIASGGTPFPPTILTQTYSSSSGPFSIPDNNTSGVAIPISVAGVVNPILGIATTTISSVTVNIDHNSIGQVEVWLCPPGATPTVGCIQLFNNTGGNGDDLVNTVFTDGSSIDISAGNPPYTGSFNLTGTNLLNSLTGSTNGTWNLIVIDNVANPSTTGTAGQWSIGFSTSVPPVNPYTYSWTPSTGISSTTNESVSFSSSGLAAPSSITHTLTVTDANGCGALAAVTTSIIGSPTLTAGASNTICNTSSTLSASPLAADQSGIWSLISGSGTISAVSNNTTLVSGLAIGDNFFKWKVQNICGADSSVYKITVSAGVIPTFNTINPICSGSSFTLSNTSNNTTPISGSWLPALTNSSTTQYTFTPSTGQCATNTVITVSVNSNPTVTALASNSVICLGNSTALTASGASTYTWTGGVSDGTVFSPTATASYTVTGTSVAGCTNTAVQTITVDPIPLVTATVTNSVICLGNSTALTASGASTYTWTGGVSDGTAFSPTATASYTVTGASVSGCTNTAIQAVTVNPTPIITALASNSVICLGNSTSLTASGAATYTWTGGVSDGTAFSPTATASYTVTGTSASGCTNTAIQTITVNPIPLVTATVTNSVICLGNSTSLTASGASTYTWTGGVSNGTVFSPTVTASYTVIGTTASGCTNTAVQTISINPAPTITASASNSVICLGNSTSLTASGASTYTWTGGVTNGTAFSPTATASYTVTGTSASGCTNTSVQTITVNPIPITTASTTGTITCATPTITLNSILAGQSYTWAAPSGGSVSSANTQSTSASGASGIYTLNVQNASGCAYSATTSVIQNTNSPTGLSAGTNQTLTCTSSSIALNGSISTPTNATVNWTGAIVCGTTTTLVTSACGAGIYTLTATNPLNGCIAISTVQVSPSAGAPLVTNNPVTNTITCTNTLVTLSVSTSVTPVTYAWSGVGIVGTTTLSSISVSQGGTFQYTVTNTSSGCATSNNQVVVQNTTAPTTTASTSGSLTCSTLTVDLNSTLAGMNYTWTTLAPSTVNTQSTTATIAGDYTLTVLDPANGCSYTTTISVAQNTTTPIGLTAGANQTLTCPSNSLTLNGSITTPTNTNVLWTGPNITGSTNSYTTTVNGAGIYTLTATDPLNGCSVAASVEVFSNAGSPVASITSTALVIDCNNASQSVTVTSSPSTDVIYNWNNTPFSASSDSSVVTFANANTYICTVTNTVSNCSTAVQVVVTSNTIVPTITITLTQTLTCATPTAAITLTTTPSSGLTYSWTGTLLSGQGTDLIRVNQPGNYSVVVTNAANGCTNTASSQVDVDANLPTASINITSTNSVITCSNQSVDLTVNVSPLATYNYTWSTASNATNISVTSANVYSVIVINPSTGCSAVAFYTVTSNTLSPAVQATNTIIPCNTTTVNVIATSTSAVTYSWTSTNGTLLTNGTSIAEVGSIGDYVVTVTDINNGCISTTTALVSQTTINSSFTANPLSGSAPLLVDFTNTSNNPLGTSYSWNFGDLNTASTTNANNTYTLIGNYTVTLTATDAASLCTATSTINIEVLENSYISVPNVFTPNGDNANDVFKIDTRGIKDLTCEIFNRWGLKIYTLIGIKDSWDGLNQTAGTYFYILSAEGYDGKEHKQQGFISLFK